MRGFIDISKLGVKGSLLLIGFMALLSLLFFIDSQHGYDISCQDFKELFFDKFKQERVIKAFLDTHNHATYKVIILRKEKYYTLSNPYVNWQDFEKIKTGDTLSKEENSFKFIVNKRYSFDLDYDCDYRTKEQNK